jgi:hypothetical protein
MKLDYRFRSKKYLSTWQKISNIKYILKQLVY